MQTTTKTITHSKTESTEMKANRPGYRIMWDMTIAGRLCQRGWLPASVKEQHWTIFKNTQGATKELEIVFSFFIDNGPYTHQELVLFA